MRKRNLLCLEAQNSFSLPMKIKKIVQIAAIFVVTSACSKPEEIEKNLSNKSFIAFSFSISQNPGLPQDIFCEINGDTLFAAAFSGTDLKALKPSYSIDGKEVTVNNQLQSSAVNSQNFTKPITYNVKAIDGSSKNYTIKFVDTQLPVVYISTNNIPIQSKETYIAGSLKIKENITGDSLYGGSIDIRGRGNSTWGFPKKPFKIKLNKKSKLLGMNEAKQWVLLANYADKSLLRNELAFELSRRFGLAYTPASRLVDVILNGQYIGNYELVEQIEVSKTKVNIIEQKVGVLNETSLTGGYLFEVDGFANTEKVNFMTSNRMPIAVHYPDDGDIKIEQKNYLLNHVEKFENALFSNDFDDPIKGYKQYFDIESYINFYLVNEIIGNPDLFWSTYLYKNQNDNLIYTGPVWDYDISANNDIRLGDTQKSLMLNVGFDPKIWINRLMQDKEFRTRIRKRWNEMKGEKLSTIDSYIGILALKLNASQRKNFLAWPILNLKVYNNFQAAGSFEGEVSYLKNYYLNRIIWLDSQFNGVRFD